MIMEANMQPDIQSEDEEEYVLLDLDSVCVQADIPANAPYVLSGLDTLNPVLTIGNRIKLIGEYQESIGMCYVFSESDGVPTVLHQQTGSSDTNLIRDTCIIDSNQAQSQAKQVKPITGLHKVLKFTLENQDSSQAANRT